MIDPPILKRFVQVAWQRYSLDGCPGFDWQNPPEPADLEMLLADFSDAERYQGLEDLAVLISQEFLSSRFDFPFADKLVNLIHCNISPFDGPERLNRIYLAFDAGELGPRNDKDPVAEFTIPVLREILEDF